MTHAVGSQRQGASIESLEGIACPQAWALALQALLAELGFHWIEIVHVDAGGQATPVRVHELLGPQASGEVTVDPRDPRLTHALNSSLPWAWDIVSLLSSGAGPAGSDWLRRLLAGGASSGLSHAVRQDDGACVVGFLSRRGGRRWMTEVVVGRALLLACHIVNSSAHARADVTAPARCADRLSVTQREILDCLSQGMGDKVIADRLGMSTHNVDYHLRRLRQHFGVRNRVQLAQATQRMRGPG